MSIKYFHQLQMIILISQGNYGTYYLQSVVFLAEKLKLTIQLLSFSFSVIFFLFIITFLKLDHTEHFMLQLCKIPLID